MKATVVIILPKLAATRKEFSENSKVGHMPLLTHVTAVKLAMLELQHIKISLPVAID